MQSAIDNIKETYDYETCKDIVNHGCQSGVCHEHIYYVDTIKFFEKYPDEITRELVSNFGTDYLVEVFKKNKADLDMYMNDLTWAFIELVAMSVVDAKEEQEIQDDLTIEGYNPERSMSMSRYANV